MNSAGGSGAGWAERRWALYAPLYDLFVRMAGPRRRSIEHLALVTGERVLIVGAGTGLDLPMLPADVPATAIDVTPEMLEGARTRTRPGDDIRIMDGQNLAFEDGTFDAAILHLILAVIPDPARCLAETARVLKPGGRIAVFDKFLPDGGAPGLLRALAAPWIRFWATDINRRLADILARSGVSLEKLYDEPAMWGGFFRIAGFRKIEPRGGR